ncbi:MAG: carboxypeptidase-like regulatory domain-containing protein, partial [Bacteroidota bacterium]
MKLFQFLFLSLLLITGCREDIERLTVETGQDNPPTISGTCTVSGRVLDENGEGIPGARVTNNFNESDLTDASGRYELRDIQIGAAGNTLYATASGYFDAWRNFLPEGGSLHQIDIVMSTTTPSGIINGATGGTLTLTDGASLTIQPGSVRQGNTVYNGDVNIAMSFDDPTSITAMEQSPGNVPALDNNFRNPRVLASLGMIELRMTDDNGRSVFLDAETPAQLFFPVPPGFQTAPQDTVFFWQLLETAWIISDQLSRVRNGFTANINGGGIYNCDVPFDQTTVCARLTALDGTPLSGQLFSIAFGDGPQLWTFRTDNRGRFCASVAIDRTLELIVPGLCPGDPPFSVTIGPFSDAPEELGDIMVDLPIVLTPLHVEECDGTNFSAQDGLVWESGQGFGRFNFTDGAGNGFLVAADCDQNFQRQIQAVAHNLRATSPVIT